MSYDRGLAHRIREVLERRPDVEGWEEREMFGGLAFMVAGHMVVGVVGHELMARVGEAAWPVARTEPGAREMTFTGRSMKTMVFVSDAAIGRRRPCDRGSSGALTTRRGCRLGPRETSSVPSTMAADDETSAHR